MLGNIFKQERGYFFSFYMLVFGGCQGLLNVNFHFIPVYFKLLRNLLHLDRGIRRELAAADPERSAPTSRTP